MISERDISEKFSAIWKQHFPLLTPNFIRVLNGTQTFRINTKQVLALEEVRFDLISEAAFNLSELAFVNEITASKAFIKEEQIKIISRTAQSIWKPGNYTDNDLSISDIEKQEIVAIAENILEFIEKLGGQNVVFKPQLKGYSFIPDLKADISIDDAIFEIKTVNRNFKSSDIKQLLIYIALKQVSEKETWKFGGLYNPRKGSYCKFNIKSSIYNLSGGKSPNEAFENLLNGLNRDVELDSRF
ncbi:MAG: hypothetical protein EOO44_14310 [Flavobacterium sp.]|nr:MAG: hypothetical protein EOO44_14310 [Flavobacterium sp.]